MSSKNKSPAPCRGPINILICQCDQYLRYCHNRDINDAEIHLSSIYPIISFEGLHRRYKGSVEIEFYFGADA